MKITFLNTWNCRKNKEYLEFMHTQTRTKDILCLQEVSSYHSEVLGKHGAMLDGWEKTKTLLPHHISYHAVRQSDWDDEPDISDPTPWGLALFIPHTIPILEYREIFILGHRNSATTTLSGDNIPVVIQACKIIENSKALWILNIHGYYAGAGVGKHDTEKRILQSQGIVDFIKTLSGDIILGGDFNLNPDTESIVMIEKAGLRNLITEFKIKSTRTLHYPEEKRVQWPHADYVFVSKNVQVKSFSVDTNSLVSDHAPMFLEIE